MRTENERCKSDLSSRLPYHSHTETQTDDMHTERPHEAGTQITHGSGPERPNKTSHCPHTSHERTTHKYNNTLVARVPVN
mmetsp:Transcript_5366/g.11577  ORF Transcript_5366/g.11577 Transcript_5366/m.11577 type:complete len:80 (-) Transcript_5366:334-573(-)